MIDKLSASQERRIMRGIEKAVASTRSGSSPNDALIKMATELEFTPEITKRACEAFNKSKTVHVLSSRKSSDRAESFEHADPKEVVKAIFGGTEKAASITLPKQDFSEIGLKLEMSFEKAAAEKPVEEPIDRDAMLKTASDVEYRRDMNKRMEVLDNFDRQKSTVNQLRLSTQDSLMKAAEHMRYTKDKELQKIAHVIVNRFGDQGAKMLQVIGAKIQRDLPLEKTANGAVLPFNSPYPEIDQAIRHAREYADEKAELTKLAEDARDFFFEKDAAPLDTKSILESGKFMGVTAPGFAAGAVKGGVKKGLDTISDEVQKWSDITSANPDPKMLKVMDPAFMGNIDSIDNMQGWVAIASDQSIKNYPIEDITEAYNNIINVSPMMRDKAMQPALKSMVKRQLAQKQLMDPAEISQLVDLEKSYTASEKTRRELDEAQNMATVGGDTGPSADLLDVLRMGGKDKDGEAKEKKMPMVTQLAELLDKHNAEKGRSPQEPANDQGYNEETTDKAGPGDSRQGSSGSESLSRYLGQRKPKKDTNARLGF